MDVIRQQEEEAVGVLEEEETGAARVSTDKPEDQEVEAEVVPEEAFVDRDAEVEAWQEGEQEEDQER